MRADFHCCDAVCEGLNTLLVFRNQVRSRVATRSMSFRTQLSKLIGRELPGLVLSIPFFKTGTRRAVIQTSGTSPLF